MNILTPPGNQCHQSHRECLLQGRKYVHFDTICRLTSPIIIQSLLHRRKYEHFDAFWTLSQITQCLLKGRTFVHFDTMRRLTSPISHTVSLRGEKVCIFWRHMTINVTNQTLGVCYRWKHVHVNQQTANVTSRKLTVSSMRNYVPHFEAVGLLTPSVREWVS